METLYSSVYASAVGICILIAVAAKNSSIQWRLRYLAVFLVLEGAGFVAKWMLCQPDDSDRAFWTASMISLSFLVAPSLWLLVRENVEQRAISMFRALTSKEKWVILAGWFCCLPLLALEFLWGWLTTEGAQYKSLYDDVIGVFLVMASAAFMLQVPYFMKRCWCLVTDYQKTHRNVSPDYEIKLSLLKTLMLILIAKWSALFFMVVYCASQYESKTLSTYIAISEVFIIIFALFKFVTQTLKLAELRSVHHSVQETEITKKTLVKEPEEKYQKSTIAKADLQRIKLKLEHTIYQTETCFDNRLSLQTLSTQLNEPGHYISQVLSLELNTNFYDIVNRRRIERAKQLLVEKPETSILDVAYSVGFNSKSTFNSAFKRMTELTPSGYRAKYESMNNLILSSS